MATFETEAEINGRDIDVMVDTGASLVALTYDDAERAGIFVKPSDFTHRAQTANGIARVAPVTISRIQIGDITVRERTGGRLRARSLRAHAARNVLPRTPVARRNARRDARA